MTDRLKNIHPGEILLADFLIPMNISQSKLARAMQVPRKRKRGTTIMIGIGMVIGLYL